MANPDVDRPAGSVPEPKARSGPAPWITPAILAAGGALILAAHRAGRILQGRGYRLQLDAPPLTGAIDPHVTAGSAVALGIGAVGVWGADRAVRRVPWRWLLAFGFLAALAWSASLALWDGAAGFTRSPSSAVDYLQAVPLVGASPSEFVRGFFTNVASYPSHVRVHPPGLVLVLWGMDKAGLGGAGWAAALEHVIGAASVPAVLLVLREVAGDARARAAAPFLVLAPSAVFWTSGDAIFLGLGAWSVAVVVLATGRSGRRGDAMALVGGALFGLGLMFSYGLALLAPLPLAVAAGRRRLRPVVLGAIAALLVVWGGAAVGFSWLEGLDVTREQYALSVARFRPYGYFVWANLAALAVALGPAAWVGLSRLRDRPLWWLAGAVLVGIALADLSGLTKAETERIWLPFMPWIVGGAGVALASGSTRARRGWLAAQVAWTLGVQLLVRSPW